MSRVEEALRRASLQSSAGTADVGHPANPKNEESAATHLRVAPGIARQQLAKGDPIESLLARCDRTSAEKLVIHPDAPLASTDQHRKLGAILNEAQLDRGIGTLMVTSAEPGEGKTLTATNLAFTLCESYQKRVLLLDADLRRPSLHSMFGIPLGPGLIHALSGAPDARLPLVEITAQLSVLSGGGAVDDPVSYFSSDRMRGLLTDVAKRFDWVIIDSSPVGMLSDGHVISTLVDAAVLVVSVGSASYTAVRRAVEAIGEQQIIGAVLNMVPERDFTTTYGSHSYYGYRYETRQNPPPAPWRRLFRLPS